jgi:DNA-binding LacI/PurR family transcriptional regulator
MPPEYFSCSKSHAMKNLSKSKEKIGLREIASAARVSVATVSRVLNGNNRVDMAIQKAVLDAATDLGVDLSQRNKVKVIAFLLSNRVMLHPFHSRVLSGAEEYCAAHGWDMVFLSFNYLSNVPWNELHLPRVIQRRDVIRAVILAGTNSTNLIDLLDHKGIPYVALGNNILGELEGSKSDLIFSDDSQGGYDITRHLISLGHRDIWFVGNIRLPWFARCFGGYSRAMDECGLVKRSSSIDSGDDTEVGYLGTKSLLARAEPVTAIFAGNDSAAHGVYKALRDSGLKIPDNISVAGCDDTVGGWLYPGLTTIREFPEQLGKQMVELVLNRIAEPALEPQRITVPTELIKRESCRQILGTPDLPLEKALQAVGNI